MNDLSAVALVVVARKRATHYFIMWTMSALYYGFSMPFAVPVTVARELIYGQLPLPRERYIAHWNNYAWRSGQPHRSLPPLSKRRELFPHFLWIFRAFVLSSRFEPMTRRESVSVLIDAGSLDIDQDIFDVCVGGSVHGRVLVLARTYFMAEL